MSWNWLLFYLLQHITGVNFNSLALCQAYYCPSAHEATLKNMNKINHSMKPFAYFMGYTVNLDLTMKFQKWKQGRMYVCIYMCVYFFSYEMTNCYWTCCELLEYCVSNHERLWWNNHLQSTKMLKTCASNHDRFWRNNHRQRKNVWSLLCK